MAKQNAGVDAKDMSKLFDALLGDGFTELRMERTVHKAETGTPVVGFIVDKLEIELEDRIWPVFLFRTTKPTKGADREGNIVDVGVDEEILVTGSAQILPVIGRFAQDPEVMYEVALMPKEKVDIGKGKTMWTYRAAISQKAPKRREGGFLLTSRAPKQLAEGTTANGAKYDTKTGEVVANG